MAKAVTETLSIEPLGNLLAVQITGPDPTEPVDLTVWSTTPRRVVTVACTLSVDDAVDLRDEITEWLQSIGVYDDE